MVIDAVVGNTLRNPVYVELLRVAWVEPFRIWDLLGRELSRLRVRIEQLAQCDQPDIDPVADAPIQQSAANLFCETMHLLTSGCECCCATHAGRGGICRGSDHGAPLRCDAVPPRHNICPESFNRTRKALAGPQQALPETAPVLLPNAATRQCDQHAAAIDGMGVKCPPGKNGTHCGCKLCRRVTCGIGLAEHVGLAVIK